MTNGSVLSCWHISPASQCFACACVRYTFYMPSVLFLSFSLIRLTGRGRRHRWLISLVKLLRRTLFFFFFRLCFIGAKQYEDLPFFCFSSLTFRLCLCVCIVAVFVALPWQMCFRASWTSTEEECNHARSHIQLFCFPYLSSLFFLFSLCDAVVCAHSAWSPRVWKVHSIHLHSLNWCCTLIFVWPV